MQILDLTSDELRDYMDLNTYLTKVVIEDPDIDADLARKIVEKASVMQNCNAFTEEQREQYRKIVEIFSRFMDD